MAVISDPEQLAGRIIDILKLENVALFAGAGTSARAGMKTWYGYLDYLADVTAKYEDLTAQLIRKRVKDDLLLEAAHLYKTCPYIPIGEKYAKLVEPFLKFDQTRIAALGSLAFVSVATTNYDRSLHDAFCTSRKKTPLCAELRDATLKEAPFWKDFYIARLHGRVEVPASIVIDTDDYEAIYRNAEYADFLHFLLRERTCLFVGFSFVDPAIDRILKFIAEKGVFPKKHYALVSADSPKLVQAMAKYNIQVIEYDGVGHHELLWKAFEIASKAPAPPPAENLPTGFDTAKRLLAVCYARAKMGEHATALKNIVVQGIIIAGLSEGLSKMPDLIQWLQRYMPLSLDEATSLLRSTLEILVSREVCMADDDTVVLVDNLKRTKADEILSPLVDGIINRLFIREKFDVKPQTREMICRVAEEVIVQRGFDLGAEFSGADAGSELDALPTINAAVERHVPKDLNYRKQHIAEAFVDLLRRPDPKEEKVLAELGRVSFGIEMILQAGRSTMYALSLPNLIYLETSVVLPAIVRGHPLRSSYLNSIEKLREASQKVGSEISVLIADVFLDEILNHRKKAIASVEELGLEDRDTLARRVTYHGASNVNVFIGAYSTWIRSAGNEELPFAKFLEEEAPYSTEAELREFLTKRGITVVSTRTHTQEEEKMFNRAKDALIEGYDREEAGLDEWAHKALVLKKHEGIQLGLLKRAASTGRRVILVTADNALRRAVSSSTLSELRDSLMSPRNLIQLVDLLIGLDVDPSSLTRLLWAVRVADERAMLKDYLVARAIPHYNAALMLRMSDLLDGHINRITREAKLEGVNLMATKTKEHIVLSKFMDRVEPEVFASLAEEVKKLDKRIKEMEKAQGE